MRNWLHYLFFICREPFPLPDGTKYQDDPPAYLVDHSQANVYYMQEDEQRSEGSHYIVETSEANIYYGK